MSDPEFTGERFVPGQGGFQIAYEHFHRYALARRWADGRDVLDIASGTGYGAALLSSCARRVWSLDLDFATVRHARASAEAGNLGHVNADALRLPFRKGSIGLAVAFEVIEHLDDQEAFLAEVARVVLPGGIALISTPDRAVYSDARDYRNPYHRREFYRDEFVSILTRFFPEVRLLSQRIHAGSLVRGDAGGKPEAEMLLDQLVGGERRVLPPMYMIAVCGKRQPRPPAPSVSAFLDLTDGLLEEWETKLLASNGEIARLNHEIEGLGEWGRKLEGELEERDRTIEEQRRRTEREISERDGTILDQKRQMEREIAERDGTILEQQRQMEREIALRDRTIEEQRRRMEREIAERDDSIVLLQGRIAELGEWGQKLLSELQERDATILEQQRRMEREIAERDGTIVEQRRQMEQEIIKRDGTILEQQRRMETEIEARDQALHSLRERSEREIELREEAIRRLQGEFEERTEWALALEREVAERDERLRNTQRLLDQTDAERRELAERLGRIRLALPYRVLCRIGLLPR